MSYRSVEDSIEDGSAIELYRFETIDAGDFFWTSGTETFVFELNTYTPQPIERDEPTLSGDTSDLRSLQIRMRVDNPVVRRYAIVVPPKKDVLTILRLHKTDTPSPEIITIFDGYISQVKVVNKTATVSLVSTSFALDRLVPRRTFRNMCNFQLGDDHCRVNLPAEGFQFTTTITVLSADGLTMTVDGIDPTGRPNGFFTAGFVANGTIDFRMILTDVTSGGNTRTFTLLLPFQEISVGATVESAAGCDHVFETCRDKFSNARRHGGFPFVPTRNPFVKGLE